MMNNKHHGELYHALLLPIGAVDTFKGRRSMTSAMHVCTVNIRLDARVTPGLTVHTISGKSTIIEVCMKLDTLNTSVCTTM